MYPALEHHLLRGFKVLPYWLDYSILQEAGPSKGDLPGQVGPWKSIEEVQQILRESGMIQANDAPVFEGPDWASPCRIESSLPPVPGLGTPITMLSPVVGYLWCWAVHCWPGEIDESWERVDYGKDQRQKTREAKRRSQLTVKGPGKVTKQQMWFAPLFGPHDPTLCWLACGKP